MMVAFTNMGWTQTAFNMLPGLFNGLGQKKRQENRRDGVPPMPGGQGMGRQSIYLMDDRGGV